MAIKPSLGRGGLPAGYPKQPQKTSADANLSEKVQKNRTMVWIGVLNL
jgi:hypothetical protein